MTYTYKCDHCQKPYEFEAADLEKETTGDANGNTKCPVCRGTSKYRHLASRRSEYKFPEDERDRERVRKLQAYHAIKDKKPLKNRKRAYDRSRQVQKRALKHGITVEFYTEMLNSQFGLCSCCLEPLSETETVHVDHCHVTGKVRGVLHNHCNMGLGQFKDNPSLLRNAADYLVASSPWQSQVSSPALPSCVSEQQTHDKDGEIKDSRT